MKLLLQRSKGGRECDPSKVIDIKKQGTVRIRYLSSGTGPEMKMVCVELKPNLSSCIETLSKKEYERTLNLLLKEGVVDDELEERLEILRLFLESADFGHLRSHYERYLTEGKKITFLVYLEEGKASYKLVVE